ncbi:hypothetical protein CHGG_09284 [Chaetomium globosum CBS 148.51]|uniref:ATP synthase assembly factor FMC1, mitochondrial n=1 Tax=Chaetomium globosum (strain ATCC 6205 / CBS 148.51 / DSM 1962 / NBRC 6347 / NRRL 1970) TaxID=306901 RepID=Q2GRX0_CHAGB|nr:uncharacterized protein CHGG_09284 [Chaetomium globosum CBS 148.51]EAQ85270.1 hypothetical protein CHGG_09284 [Chaetomium globosum CBS 148.51]
MASTRSLYRSLLRELPPRPLLSTPRAPLHQRLRDNFQQPQSSTSPAAAGGPTADLRAAQAEQYVAYLRAQRTYVTLLERYNPGMGMDEEERVRLTARRVGMDLPVELSCYMGLGGVWRMDLALEVVWLWRLDQDDPALRVKEEKRVEKPYINHVYLTLYT